MSRLPPRTLAISQRASISGDELPDWASALAAHGVDAVQLREKDLPVGRLLGLALRIRQRLPPTVALLINGRLDVAVACGAAGVHLPSDGVPIARVRRRFADLLIGASTHRLEEIHAAREAGADYVTFGPVFAPTSKVSPLEPTGLGRLAQAATLGIPVLALGGVTIERLPEIAEAGAAGVAAIGAFHTGPDRDGGPGALVALAHRLFRRSTAPAGG